MADIVDAAPVSGGEFAVALQALLPDLPVAVAVSGGADSMALLHLTHGWLKRTGNAGALLALTVDHGLREGSAQEARQIAGWCRELGISHTTLVWRGPKPFSDVQAAAREARYRLLRDACTENGIQNLLLGHQREDQAETFLMRLGRGSGVDGLSAMAPVRQWKGVRLLRPLLGFSRLRLRATLTAERIAWIEDPSNRDPRFARVRMRGQLENLAEAGISQERLTATAQRMRRVRLALEEATSELMRTAVQWDPSGYAALNLPPLFAAPEEIGLRTLMRVMMGVGGLEYPPRLVRLERLYAWLRQSPATGGRTLCGCRIVLRGGRMLVVREMAAIGPELLLAPGQSGTWDKRFQVWLGDAANGLGPAECTVRAVGSDGLSLLRLRDSLPQNPPPAIIAQAGPGFWQGRQLLAAPCLGYVDPAYFAAESVFQASFAPAIGLWPDSLSNPVNV